MVFTYWVSQVSPRKSFLDLNELKSIQVGNEDVCNGVVLLHCRYRAIMYPLRRKPSKLFSKAVIFLIWILGLLFALPMGLLHSFGYVDDPAINESGQEVVRKKPFCYLDFGAANNATLQPPKLTFFKYYRYEKKFHLPTELRSLLSSARYLPTYINI